MKYKLHWLTLFLCTIVYVTLSSEVNNIWTISIKTTDFSVHNYCLINVCVMVVFRCMKRKHLRKQDEGVKLLQMWLQTSSQGCWLLPRYNLFWLSCQGRSLKMLPLVLLKTKKTKANRQKHIRFKYKIATILVH